LQRSSQSFLVNFAGQMDRAFAVYRIPAGGIRAAKILDFQADANQGVVYRQIYYARRSLPGCPAGCSFQNRYVGYPAV